MPERSNRNRRLSRLPRERGFALIMVLWAAVLLALIVGAIASAVRTDLKLANNQVQAARAELAADAGLWIAVRQLERQGPQVWLTNGTVYAWTYDGLNVRVRITDEYGRIDINHAPPDILARMFTAAGLDQAAAIRHADAIAAYRKTRSLAAKNGGGLRSAPESPPVFNTSEELLLVPGIEQSLYKSIETAITVYSGQERPPFGIISPIVLTAIGLKPQGAPFTTPFLANMPSPSSGTAPVAINQGGPTATGFSGLIRIEAEAFSADGAHFARTAVLFMPVQPGDPVRTYYWARGTRQFFPASDR